MKKCVALFLVIAIALNVFGFGFSAYSSAVAESVFVYVVCPALIGVLSSILGTTIVNYADPNNILERVNASAISNGEAIQLYEQRGQDGEHYRYSFVPGNNLDSDTEEFAQFVCDYFNNRGDTERIASSFMQSGLPQGQYGCGSLYYETTKTDAVNAFTAYLECKQRSINISNEQQALQDLCDDLGVDNYAPYTFSFEGPLTPAQLFGLRTELDTQLEKDGYIFQPAHVYTGNWNCRFPDMASAYAFGQNVYGFPSEWNGGIYFNWYLPENCTQCGMYVLYNKVPYYYIRPVSQVNIHDYGNGKYYGFYEINGDNWRYTANYVSADNVKLSDVHENMSVLGLVLGGITCVSNNALPSISDDDFTITTQDQDIDVPLKSDENIIGQYMKAVPKADGEDYNLTIGEDGSITAVDGVSLADIESLLQDIKNKTYDFSSFEEYLSRITSLLEAEGVEAGKISDILSTLRAWETTQSNALDQINSNIATISQALTISQSGDLDLPDDSEADVFQVSHTGLSEATSIVNNLTIVQQVSNLISGLLDPDLYSDEAPNFHFYYDSDNNGVSEVYTAFDLSFLDQTLDNSNLEDKNRFQDPMTYRQFLQIIIICTCYISFGWKLLRKLPGLLSGGESPGGETDEHI